MRDDFIEVYANMNKFRGEHWLDKEKKIRFMRIYGRVFYWDVDAEVFRLYEGVR